MIRASVTANDVNLADAIATILAERLCPDVLQQSYRPPSQVYAAVRDPRSIVIDIDEGLTVSELLIMPADFRIDDPMLLIKVSLHSQNMRAFRSYSLSNLGADEIIPLVKKYFHAFPGRRGFAVSRASNLLDGPVPNPVLHQAVQSHRRESSA